MNKQLFLLLGGAVLIALLMIGRTVGKKDPLVKGPAMAPHSEAKAFNINAFLDTAKQNLSPARIAYINRLESSAVSGATTEQIKANKALADFWNDSLKAIEPYVYYISRAAKLDNSEKNLTFAAQLNLDALRGEQDEAKINWEAEQAIDLFESAIKLNPDNDSLKVGLGSCYVFGKGRFGGPQETMKGIQQLLEVVRRDSTNMQAQLVLGIGGYTSGQYDKAIERLLKVVNAEPNNVQAIAFLADTYAATGQKAEAIKWYTISKHKINDPHYTKEVDARIKELQ